MSKLPLRERIVERVDNVLDAHAQARGCRAVDANIGLQAALLTVGGDIGRLRQLLHPLDHARHPSQQLVDIGAPQRELVCESLCRPPTRRSCAGTIKTRIPGIRLSLARSRANYGLRGCAVALIERLQADDSRPRLTDALKPEAPTDERDPPPPGRRARPPSPSTAAVPWLRMNIGRGCRAAEIRPVSSCGK